MKAYMTATEFERLCFSRVVRSNACGVITPKHFRKSGSLPFTVTSALCVENVRRFALVMRFLKIYIE